MTHQPPYRTIQVPFPFFLITAALLFCALSLPGCNPAQTKDIVKINSDTYKIAKKGEDSLEIRQGIWQQADSYCRKNNQYFMPIAKNFDQNFYEMEFRCLNTGDPELLEGETPFQEKRYDKKLGGYGKIQY